MTMSADEPRGIAAYSAARVELLGGAVLTGARAAIDLWTLLLATLVGVIRTWRGGRPEGEVMRQMHVIGNRSLLFIGVTLGFLGMVMVYQACLQFAKVTGDLSQVGVQFIRLVVSDFAATLAGMMLATRVGAGIAAEIGSMKVTEQVDALRMSGVLPVDYLIVPRFLASVVMTVVLTLVGGTIMYVAGGLTAQYSFGVNPNVFYDLSLVNWQHLVLGLGKSTTYGMAIPVVAGFCGLRAQGSSEGVGWATTSAVIGSSFAVIVLDFVWSIFGFLTFGASL
jgi:phospholipid/cholesterol/gamma-HCH transport system permease protein